MKDSDLLIWYYRNILPVGIPHKEDMILFDSYNSEKKKFYSVSEWRKVEYTPMPFPPEREIYRLPNVLFCVLKKKIKGIYFDYYDLGGGVKLVSESFKAFILKHGIGSGFEAAELKIVNKHNELLTDKKYFVLRFGKFDDELFDFNEQTKQRGKHTFGATYYTYPDMILKSDDDNRSVFVLKESSYRNAFIFKSELLGLITEFYKPDLYSVKDFPYIYDNQYDEVLLPLNNSLKKG